VWDPYKNSLTRKIEIIAIEKWVFSNYDYHSSVSNMLADLHWPTPWLEERWGESRLSLLSRISY